VSGESDEYHFIYNLHACAPKVLPLISVIVARVVHYLGKSLVGKTLSLVQAQDDPIVFGKVGTSGAEVQKALTGKKVLDVGRQGKYFWYETVILIEKYSL
jgi:formamidopyrimidine-DNA glycosylase